jgi:hypothetical protein
VKNTPPPPGRREIANVTFKGKIEKKENKGNNVKENGIKRKFFLKE